MLNVENVLWYMHCWKKCINVNLMYADHTYRWFIKEFIPINQSDWKQNKKPRYLEYQTSLLGETIIYNLFNGLKINIRYAKVWFVSCGFL